MMQDVHGRLQKAMSKVRYPLDGVPFNKWDVIAVIAFDLRNIIGKVKWGGG